MVTWKDGVRGFARASVLHGSRVVMRLRKMNHALRNIFLWAATFAFLEPLPRELAMRSAPQAPVAWAPHTGQSVLLRGLEIMDVDKGQVLHRRGLLIQDGRIKDIIPGREAATFPADRVIDAPGFYALPGLINAHCHILLPMALDLHQDLLDALKRQAERNLEECIVHGVTTVRDAETFPLLLLRFKERIEGGELLGSRILMAGSFITAPEGYHSDYMKPFPPSLARRWGDYVLVVKTPARAKEAVKRNHELGCCFIKTAPDDRAIFVGQKSLPTLDDDSMAAVVEQAHALGLKVSAHHRFRRSTRHFTVGDGIFRVPGKSPSTGKKALMNDESWDVIVVGAGLGGLTAALRLAKEGLRVLVVEAASHPGGTAYVYRRGKFLFPMGPLGCSNPELVRLILSRSGLDEPPDFDRVHYGLHAFGLSVTLSRPFPEMAARLSRVFPEEKEAVETFFQDMEWIAREHLAIPLLTGVLSEEDKGPGFHFPYSSTQGGLRAKRNKRVFPLGARAQDAARSGSGTMPGVAGHGQGSPPAQRQSAASYLEGMVKDPRLRRILGSMGTRDPYSNLALLAVMWYLLCESGIHYPQGGFHGLGDTLAALLGGKADATWTQTQGVPEARAFSSDVPGTFATSPGEGRGARRLAPSPPGTGASLVLGCRVRRILVRGGRAYGVQLDDGSTIASTAVVSNADFKNTFLRLVDAGELPTPFLRRLESASLTSSNLQVCLGLEARRVDLSAFQECSHLIYRRPGSEPGEAKGERRKRREGEPEPERLAGEELELCLLSADDATLAPPGKAVLVIRVAVPYEPFLRFRGREGSRKPGYPEFKARLGRALVREASSLVPGLEDAVQVMDVATPLTFEERGGRFEGAVAGWSWEFGEGKDRLVELVLTPISGLYMAGHQAFSMLALGGVPSAVLSGLRAAEYALQGRGPVEEMEIPGIPPAGSDR